MIKVFMYISLLLFSASAISANVTGKIKVVQPNTNAGWNGVLIQMANGKIVDANCGNNTWALIKVNNALDKVLVSTALTAQTTQSDVRVFTNECSAPPATIGTIPVVYAIDLGIRD